MSERSFVCMALKAGEESCAEGMGFANKAHWSCTQSSASAITVSHKLHVSRRLCAHSSAESPMHMNPCREDLAHEKASRMQFNSPS